MNKGFLVGLGAFFGCISFMVFKAFEQSRKDKEEQEKISRKIDEDIAKTMSEIEDKLEYMKSRT
jgi:hypothetical protein